MYEYWKNVLTRTHDSKYHEKFPAYLKARVVENWKPFMGFYEWAETQDYSGDKVLDKDILGDGTLYSPETCCFIPERVNNFLVGHTLKGSCLKGASFDKESGKFKASIGMLGKTKNLGRYFNQYEAHLVYCKAKLSYSFDIVNEYQVEDRVAAALIAKLQKKVDEAEVLYQQSLI